MVNWRPFRIERPSQFYHQELSYEKGRQTSGGVFIENTITTILAKELMKRIGTSMLINIINLSLQMFREYHPPDLPGIGTEVKRIKSKGATCIDGFQNNNS